MQIIPVIDIRNGIAVRAVAGERSRYRAIQSRLTTSAEPAEVLQAMKDSLQCTVCYVADLDAIERQQLNRCTITELVRKGVSLTVDAGATTIAQIEELFDIGVDRVVLSSESIGNLAQLGSIIRQFDPTSLIFSIDLRHGQLLVKDPAWEEKTPLDMARFVVELGIHQFIVLDLAAVGTGLGVSTLELCRMVRDLSPEVQVISGGGVASGQCVADAAQAGLRGLLIGSALHDGRLTNEDLTAHLRTQ